MLLTITLGVGSSAGEVAGAGRVADSCVASGWIISVEGGRDVGETIIVDNVITLGGIISVVPLWLEA